MIHLISKKLSRFVLYRVFKEIWYLNPMLKERKWAAYFIRYPIGALIGSRFQEHQFENQFKLWIEKAKKYDFSRGTRMAAFRFFLLTPLENRWMIFAERKFTGRTLFNLTKKVSIDQFMIGPILMICFFTYNEGELLSLDDAMMSHSGVLAVFGLTH